MFGLTATVIVELWTREMIHTDGDKIQQIIEYEWKSLFDRKCQKIGHNCDNPKPKKQWLTKTKPPDVEPLATDRVPTEIPDVRVAIEIPTVTPKKKVDLQTLGQRVSI